MYAKIVVACLLLGITYADHHASSYASIHNHVEPVYGHGDEHHGHHYEPQHHPKYEYKYGVEDYHTHDIKSANEHRDGDVVHGEYSVVQPDGRTRIVHYTADKHNGFNAQVTYTGHANHPQHHHDHY